MLYQLVNISTDLQTVIYYLMITARVIYFLNNFKSFFLPIALHPLLRIMRGVHCAARFTAVLYKDSYKSLPNLFLYILSSLKLSYLNSVSCREINQQKVNASHKALVNYKTFRWLIVLVFYGPSAHFRSFRAQSVNIATLFLGKPPRQFTSTQCPFFRQ